MSKKQMVLGLINSQEYFHQFSSSEQPQSGLINPTCGNQFFFHQFRQSVIFEMDVEREHVCRVNEIEIEKKFIKVYKRLTHLWNPNHPDYNNRFKRNLSYDILLKVYRQIMPKATRSHVRQKINNLRSCYRKHRRRLSKYQPFTLEGKVIKTSITPSWKFQALKFLDSDHESDNENENVDESNSLPENYEEETIQEPELDSANEDQNSSKLSISPVYIEEKPIDWTVSNNNVNNVLDREFKAIGANVAYKLQRMSPDQRCHAELLINKVLITGLKEKLTEETDLTDVWRIENDVLEPEYSGREDPV